MAIHREHKVFKASLLLWVGLTLTHTAVAASAPDSTFSSFLSKLNPKNASILLQAGAFETSQGEEQSIPASDELLGNRYTVDDDQGSNVLLGAGYYIDGLNKQRFDVMFGVDAFYFGHTTVNGHVFQEQQYDNLTYRYSIQNYPIYAATKLMLKSNSGNYDVTFDAGVGPNFIRTSDYEEAPNVEGALSDDEFAGQTEAVLSATVGMGIRFNHLLGNLPCELSYRFFYLGDSQLQIKNEQLLKPLQTGDNYANALMLSLYF